jgi:Glycosyltransferase sugar-binding region containing DXD motif
VPSIPKILHYTFGMASDFGGKPWGLVHHVCLKSAIERIAPEQVFFYYEFEPSGPWWNLSRELVTLVRIEAPRQIFDRPLPHVAHRSDVVRLQKLIEHGGIYLDADVLVQRSFDDLLAHSAVLGQEGTDAEWGLANAVMLAEPRSPFLCRWLDEYRSFRSTGRDEFWNEHSVQLPSKLARAYPEEVTVLPFTAFFWPLWTKEHIEWIFASNRPIPLEHTYCNHLWEAGAWDYLDDLTPRRVRSVDTNFHRWARPFIAGLPDSYGAPPLRRRAQKLKRQTMKNVRYLRSATKRALVSAIHQIRLLTIGEPGIRRKTFQDAYKRNLWGKDSHSQFYSGAGSRGEAAQIYVERMVELLQQHATELGRPLTVVDLGCGDFQIGSALMARLPDFTYIGCDIVPELVAYNNKTYANERVSFQRIDIVASSPPEGDVCLVRQVLQHLSNAEIAGVLPRLNQKFVYVTEGHPVERTGPANPDKVTSFDVRFDWRTGRGRGVELGLPPYELTTQETFRASVPPNEIIVTERLLLVSH